MKKFIALAIAIVMLAALAVPAFAANNATKVEYNVTETYEFEVIDVVILQKADVDAKAGEAWVKINAMNILDASTITIATADDVITLTQNDGAEADTATVKLEQKEFTFTTDEGASTKTYDITWVELPDVAASYSATFTFNATLNSARNAVEE